MARWLMALLVLLPVVALASDEEPPFPWQETVAMLAAEETRAVGCVRALKTHSTEGSAVWTRGDLAYTDAKAEMDAAIAVILQALAAGTAPTEVDVPALIDGASLKRQAFCDDVVALIPEEGAGAKPKFVKDLLVAAVEGLPDAVASLLEWYLGDDVARRETIANQIRQYSWPAFNEIPAETVAG